MAKRLGRREKQRERERQTGVNFNYAIHMYGNVIHKITITGAFVVGIL